MSDRYRIPTGYVLGTVCAVFLALAQVRQIEMGQRLATELCAFLVKMALLLPCVFALIGLLDAWIPSEWTKKQIGEGSGLRGALCVTLLAMFQGGPLYAAFPAAHLLREKGCSIRNVFLYLGAFSSLKIPMALFEASFLGWRFALVRAAIALPVFVLIAEAMAIYIRRRPPHAEAARNPDAPSVPEAPGGRAFHTRAPDGINDAIRR